MESAQLWRLFLETGLPEAYSLYSLAREAEKARYPAEAEKTA